jgi:hypothetical protein
MKPSSMDVRERLLSMAVEQARRAMLREMERLQAEGISSGDIVREAARRVLEQLRAGTWKPAPGEADGLAELMIVSLDLFLRRETDDLGAGFERDVLSRLQ